MRYYKEDYIEELVVKLDESNHACVSMPSGIYSVYNICGIDMDRDWTNIAMNPGKNVQTEVWLLLVHIQKDLR